MPGREGGLGGVSGSDRSHISAQKVSPCCGWELGVMLLECILPMEAEQLGHILTWLLLGRL